jgi:hypothetical protein
MFGNTGMLEIWLKGWFDLGLRICFKMYVDVFDRSQVKVDAEQLTNFFLTTLITVHKIAAPQP